MLISSDLLARGIDIPSVDLVVNWDIPFTNKEGGWKVANDENYLRRISKTGRFGTEGVVLNVAQGEYDPDYMNQIKDYYKTFTITEITDFDIVVKALD